MEYDVIIVGAGTAGSVLAARLSEDPSRSVLLLEGGPVYPTLDALPKSIQDPSDISNSLPGSPHNWGLRGTLRENYTVPIARGKGIGGSGSINGAYFIRGTRHDFDNWVAAGNVGWSYDDVLPYYIKAERDLDFTADYHGTNGPIPVKREAMDRAPEFTGALTDAAVGLGFDVEADKNAGGSGGIGPVPMNIEDGKRQSTALTYLYPALKRPNLNVIGNALVTKVVVEAGRCTGVDVLVDGKSTTFRANETILAAGALRTPQILMLSGIGPSDDLRRRNIEVINDLPGVGQNLTDHPELGAKWTFRGKTSAVPGRGLLTSALNWGSEGSAAGVTDLELLPFVCSAGDMMRMTKAARNPFQALKAMRGTSMKFAVKQAASMWLPFVAIGLQQEDSRGWVKLTSADPTAQPELNWNLMAESSDRRRFREGIKVTYDLFATDAFRKIGGKLVNLSKDDVKSNATLDAWAQQNIFTVGHASSTCKMGPESDPAAVVDRFGAVYGIQGLRISDTSIFPVIPSRGPNATTAMVAERISEFVK